MKILFKRRTQLRQILKLKNTDLQADERISKERNIKQIKGAIK